MFTNRLHNNEQMLADGTINAIDNHKNLCIGNFSFKILCNIIMFKILVDKNSEPNPQINALIPNTFGKNQIDKINNIAPII